VLKVLKERRRELKELLVLKVRQGDKVLKVHKVPTQELKVRQDHKEQQVPKEHRALILVLKVIQVLRVL
jgi:hypothetical protein